MLRESYPAGYAVIVPAVGNAVSNKVLPNWMSQLEGNPAFLSGASPTHKFTGHAHGPEKSAFYRFSLFSWHAETEIKLPRPRDAAPRQLPYDGEGSPPLAEGTAVPSLLESDHGDIGLRI